ncbi:hypothetical protein HaLaN_03001, partial [Haematococcus lacustris]
MSSSRPASWSMTGCPRLGSGLQGTGRVPCGLVGKCHRDGVCSHKGCDRGCFNLIEAAECTDTPGEFARCTEIEAGWERSNSPLYRTVFTPTLRKD